MYTLHGFPAAFHECLITVVIALLRTNAILKMFLYYSLLCLYGKCIFWFRKFLVDYRRFLVFALCHRAYSKYRQTRKILICPVFEVLRPLALKFRALWKEFFKSIAGISKFQSVAQSYWRNLAFKFESSFPCY